MGHSESTKAAISPYLWRGYCDRVGDSMARQRAIRVAEAIKQEVSSILQRDIKDPGLGFVSVTSVEVSNDLRHTKIYVSIYGDAEAKSNTMAALRRARGYIRSEIGRRIRLRHTPDIVFIADESIEHASRIQELLREVVGSNEGQRNSPSTEGE